ncbi:hypothetical protein KCU95_g1, partial [Aureobasidium melanogenum]
MALDVDTDEVTYRALQCHDAIELKYSPHSLMTSGEMKSPLNSSLRSRGMIPPSFSADIKWHGIMEYSNILLFSKVAIIAIGVTLITDRVTTTTGKNWNWHHSTKKLAWNGTLARSSGMEWNGADIPPIPCNICSHSLSGNREFLILENDHRVTGPSMLQYVMDAFCRKLETLAASASKGGQSEGHYEARTTSIVRSSVANDPELVLGDKPVKAVVERFRQIAEVVVEIELRLGCGTATTAAAGNRDRPREANRGRAKKRQETRDERQQGHYLRPARPADSCPWNHVVCFNIHSSSASSRAVPRFSGSHCIILRIKQQSLWLRTVSTQGWGYLQSIDLRLSNLATSSEKNLLLRSARAKRACGGWPSSAIISARCARPRYNCRNLSESNLPSST